MQKESFLQTLSNLSDSDFTQSEYSLPPIRRPDQLQSKVAVQRLRLLHAHFLSNQLVNHVQPVAQSESADNHQFFKLTQGFSIGKLLSAPFLPGNIFLMSSLVDHFRSSCIYL